MLAFGNIRDISGLPKVKKWTSSRCRYRCTTLASPIDLYYSTNPSLFDIANHIHLKNVRVRYIIKQCYRRKI